MKKISFSLLIFLMTAALIGIILVQSFWIKTTIDTKERQFSLNVNQALKSVADDIKISLSSAKTWNNDPKPEDV